MMLSIWIIKSGIKSVVVKNQVCVFVTKDRKIEFLILPIEDGKVQAPPHHRFAEGHERIYFINRQFSLHGQFPPFIWSFLQESGSFAIYEEGDPQPILPSDERSFVSPEMVQSLINQNVIALLVKKVGDEFGKFKGAVGQYPWYFWAIIIVILLLSLANVWVGLNVLNILLPPTG
jgi:hypothetical protein